jgi:hypothetical protein
MGAGICTLCCGCSCSSYHRRLTEKTLRKPGQIFRYMPQVCIASGDTMKFILIECKVNGKPVLFIRADTGKEFHYEIFYDFRNTL